MDKGRFLTETHLRTGRSIKELAAAHQVSESWLFKLLRRYRLEGPGGLEPRSCRPKTSPTRIAGLYEDEIVRRRKELAERGFDAGAETIHFHMATPGREIPSVSTIHRVLVARGFVTPEPHKRPRSSWTRFEAEFPNECWQADVTHVEVADDVVYEVLNVIDDHSRLCVASRVFVATRSPDVVRTLHKAAAIWGYPKRFLTDNGRIFTTPPGSASWRHGGRIVVPWHRDEALSALPPPDLRQGRALPPDDEEVSGQAGSGHDEEASSGSAQPLRRLLQHRATASKSGTSHAPRGLERPGKAGPVGPRIEAAGYRIRHDKVDRGGSVTLRYKGKLHHIGVGCPYAGWRVILLVAGLDVRIIGIDGSPLRHLTLDPSVDYQRIP